MGLLKQVGVDSTLITGSTSCYYSSVTISPFLQGWDVLFSGKGVGGVSGEVYTYNEIKVLWGTARVHATFAAEADVDWPGLVSKGSQRHPQAPGPGLRTSL